MAESLTQCHFSTEALSLNFLLLYKNTTVSVFVETVLFVTNGSVNSKRKEIAGRLLGKRARYFSERVFSRLSQV